MRSLYSARLLGFGPVRRLLGVAGCGLAALLVLVSLASSPVAARASMANALDADRDPRLAQPVLLRSAGIPLSYVIQRLSKQTGVLLTTSGPCADERLVAFVPRAPLAEVMRSVADLYRLCWTCSTSEPPAYRLGQTPAAVHEAAALREQHLRQALDRAGQTVEQQEQQPDPGRSEPARALSRFALRLVKSHWSRLLRDGVVTLPVASLSPAEQDALRPHLQPFLTAANEQLRRDNAALLEALIEMGEDPERFSGLEDPGPPALAGNTTFTIQLRREAGLELIAGLREGRRNSYRTHALLQVTDRDAQTAGVSLYGDRQLRPEYGMRDPSPPPTPLDAFSRPLNTTASGEPTSTGWIAKLEWLSDTAGIAVYADDYLAEYARRDSAQLAPGVSVQAALDRLCGGRGYGNIWWRRGAAALIRSKFWLWEEETVLPAGFPARVVEALRDEEHLDRRALPALASLSLRQVQGLSILWDTADAWRYAVLAPSRLSPEAQQALFSEGGLSWERLSTADRMRLQEQGLPGLDSAAPLYSAQIESATQRCQHTGGKALAISVESVCGPDSVTTGFEIPLSETDGNGLLVVNPDRIYHPHLPAPPLVFALYYLRPELPAGSKPPTFPHTPTATGTGEAAMGRHLRELKSAGVDVLACPWRGPDRFEDRALRQLLPLARESGLRVCLVLEPYGPKGEKPTPTLLTRDLASILTVALAETAYLQVEGRPVVFISPQLRARMTLQAWADALALLRRRNAPGVCAVLESWNGDLAPDEFDVGATACVFGALQALPDMEGGPDLATAVARIRVRGCAAVGTVFPGLDLRRLVKDEDAVLDRGAGGLYRTVWDAVVRARPEWVVIDSFNRWETGTEIEPSREYGDTYLKLTAEYAARFHQPAVRR